MSLPRGIFDDGDHDDYPALTRSLPPEEAPSPPSRRLSRDSFDSAASCSAASSSMRSASSSMYSDRYYDYLAQRQQTSQLLNDYHDYITTIEQTEAGESTPPIVRSPQNAYDGGKVAPPRGADPRGPSRGLDPPAVDAMGMMGRLRFLKLKNRQVQMDLDTLQRREGRKRSRIEQRLTAADNLAWQGDSDEFESKDDPDYDSERVSQGSISKETREENLARIEWLKLAVFVSTVAACLLALVIALVARKDGWAYHDHDAEILSLPARSSSPDNNSSVSVPNNMSSGSGESFVVTSFSRSQGWDGQTYQAAVDFCSSKSLSLCSYSAVCPFGPGSEPRLPNGGFDDVAWISIGDGRNSWVQVGEQDLCLRYEFIHGNPPAWGETGEDNEEITSHAVCCPHPDRSSTTSPSNAVSSSRSEGADASDRDFQLLAETPTYQEDLETVWYSSSDGWTGSTFDDAHDFCGAREDWFPCPYEAYCPKGPHQSPAEGGPPREGAEHWSPIVDEVGNGLVLVGGNNGKDSLCRVSYPERGGQSENRPVTHVMCCRLLDQEL